MLPSPTNGIGIGALSLPELPPVASGPNPSGPGFSKLYDRLATAMPGIEEQRALPTSLEVAPIMSPASSLAQPFKPSPEFPGAVDPDSMRVGGASAPLGSSAEGLTSFLEPFKQGIDQVNRAHYAAANLANEAALGGDVDLHDVMIASEKAGVAMQLTLQIRNKIVEAYQDVMRMQV